MIISVYRKQWKIYEKESVCNWYITHKILGRNYAAIHEIKPALMLNRPIYVGFTVLDLTKWRMYDSHYNFIKKEFWCWIIVYWHRQSLTRLIKDFKVFDETNKKVIGKMEDEFGGIIVTNLLD